MNEKKDIIQWHNGFVPAMELDFREDRHLLTFLKEHNLNAMPNRIDLLIIRKESKAILKNDIGKIFRGHNITDYKSPDDALNMDTLYKTYGYAYLYKAYEKHKDEIGIDDITVSLIREGKPREMFSELESMGAEITEKFKGIYYVEGSVIQFPTQIVVYRECERQHHEWLKALTKRITEEETNRLYDEKKQFLDKADSDNARSVFDIIYHANKRLFLDHKEGNSMYAVVKDLFLTEYAQGIIETARDLKATDEYIISILARRAEIETDEAKRLLEEYDSKPVTA